MKDTEHNNNQNTVLPIPQLSEFVDAARLIIRELKDAGASPGEIIDFLKGTSQLPDAPQTVEIEVELEVIPEVIEQDVKIYKPAKHTYTARQIARKLGLYSMYGKPHAHAVSAILNNNLCIGNEHKDVRILFVTEELVVYYTLYDAHAVVCAQKWVQSNDYPYEVDGFYYTYHVRYGN